MVITRDNWLEAQRAVIGSALIDSAVVPAVIAGTTEQDYTDACRTVFTAIKALFVAGKPVDPITINAHLGGAYDKFLMDLMEITPTAANVDAYISLCRDNGRLIRLRELGQQMQDAASLDDAVHLMEQANQAMVSRAAFSVVSMEDAMTAFFDRHSGSVSYLSWPIDTLNKVLFAEAGDFIILAGYPSDGKSALAIQTAYHMAETKRVGFFSLETNPHKLFDRMISHAASIDMSTLKTNSLTDADWDTVAQKSDWVIRHNLEYIPAAGMTVADIRAISQARRYDVIFVDYLQLVSGPGRDRYAIVTDVSIGLHNLSQSTGITVIALAQLNRPEQKTVKGQNGRSTTVTPPPELRNLRESGQIEQDADIVMFVYRPNPDQTDRMLLVRKNKEGELGSIALHFDGAHQTFYRTFPRVADDTPVPWEQGRCC